MHSQYKHNNDNNPSTPVMPQTVLPVVKTDLDKHLKLIATGKVREIYEIDAETLLFVATDRISGTPCRSLSDMLFN